MASLVTAQPEQPTVNENATDLKKNLIYGLLLKEKSLTGTFQEAIGDVIKSLERQIYKEGTVIPDKDSGYDHFNDSLGYMIEYLYPIRRDFNPTRPKRWS